MPVIADPPQEAGSDAPGAWRAGRLSDGGGLTQFGALVQELAPGAASADPHWHAAEDEMVYLLDGAITMVEGDARHALRPGQAACFRAGVAVAHCLVNESDAPARGLVIGTRSGDDVVTYADGRVRTVRDGMDTLHGPDGTVIERAKAARS